MKSLSTTPDPTPSIPSFRTLTWCAAKGIALLAIALAGPLIVPTRADAIVVVRRPLRAVAPCVVATRPGPFVVVSGPRWRWRHRHHGYRRDGIFIQVR